MHESGPGKILLQKSAYSWRGTADAIFLSRPLLPAGLVFDSLLCRLFCALLHTGNNYRAIVLGPMKEQ